MVNKKCILLFSGGLDSRLALKIMQERGYNLVPVFFKLPFSCPDIKDACDFVKNQGFKLKIFDCTKGDLFREYIKIIKKAKYGRGKGVNPCIDCKIFMFNIAREFADDKKIDLIVTGEVLNQRPMSQNKNQICLIEKESGLEGRLLRPLIEEGISGRQRKKQIDLARRFKIKYPHPAGGCLLCEKLLKKRFHFLFKRGLNEKELPLVSIGRHFVINGSWIILGRNEKENKIIEDLGFGKLVISEDFGIVGPSVLVLGGRVSKKKIGNLIIVYSKHENIQSRNNFEKYKI